MRAVVAWIVATVASLALLAPVAAAPPEDVAAYCRATYPQVQFQIRCLNVEHAAAARVARAGPGVDREVFSQCLSGGASWAAVEACLTQSVPGGAPAGASAETSGSTEPDASGPGREPVAGPGLPRVAGGALLPPAPVERPTRPISEADADRQLRGVLERTGSLTAQCTKKQYGPGWVSICQ